MAVRAPKQSDTAEPRDYDPWDYCDCSLHANSHKTAPCGCGSHEVMIPRPGSMDVVIHWLGQHWRMTCAFYEATDRLDDLHALLLKRRK